MRVASVGSMSSKGTARRTVRVSDEVWDAAMAVAEARGETLSDVIRDALIAYAAKDSE